MVRTLDSASENDEVKLLWDVNIQCDHVIEARRPDIMVVNKQERKCTIIDIAVPADKRIGEKENEKVEKYQNLKRETARMWNMRTVQVVPIVVGSLGSVTNFITTENYVTGNGGDFEKGVGALK